MVSYLISGAPTFSQGDAMPVFPSSGDPCCRCASYVPESTQKGYCQLRCSTVAARSESCENFHMKANSPLATRLRGIFR